MNKYMRWCLSIIELKNARWNIEIRKTMLIYLKSVGSTEKDGECKVSEPSSLTPGSFSLCFA